MAYTGATTGFAAGAETNSSAVGYALETTYNQPPTGAYQALRYTDVSLAVNETETQPDEINDTPEMAQSVLTGRTTQGSISGILSVGTFEDMLAGVMTSDFISAVVTASDDIILSVNPSDMGGGNGKPTIWSHSAGNGTPAFSSFPNSGIVHIFDKSKNIDVQTTYYKSNSGTKDSVLIIDFSPFPVSANAFDMSSGSTVSFNGIVNGKIGRTFTFRKELSSYFEFYTGTMVNQVQISLQKGQPATISLDLLGSDVTITDADIAASVTPRTTTPLINTVDGFMGCEIFGNVPSGCIQSVTLTLSRDGSGQDTGMGHVGACGVRLGSFKAAMEITYLFRDYKQFTDWQNGKTGPVTVGVKGGDGVGYQFTVLNGIIRNPKTPISGKNQTVVATVSITANPVPGGGTFAISRISS